MGILDNIKISWDEDFLFESKPMPVTDDMGRDKFWEDMGRPAEAWEKGPAVYDSLAVKLFSEICCTDCSCKHE